MPLKDLLRSADLTREDVLAVLDLADAYMADPGRDARLLAGRLTIHYFAKPSTRTRLSLQAAAVRLGATPSMIGANELQLQRGESVEDTARVISRYATLVTMRTFDDDEVATFAGAATIPVVNALTDGHHPLQALADLQVLRHHFGDLKGRKLAYLGDGNNVVHSLVETAATVGLDISVACPPGFEPRSEIVARARRLASAHGTAVEVVNDPRAAVDDADALYTDVWLSMGDSADTATARRRALRPFRVTADLMRRAKPDAVFLHCLPAHRGEEVDADVIDGPRSLVFDQAECRLHTSQAVMALLVQGSLSGRPGDPAGSVGL